MLLLPAALAAAHAHSCAAANKFYFIVWLQIAHARVLAPLLAALLQIDCSSFEDMLIAKISHTIPYFPYIETI